MPPLLLIMLYLLSRTKSLNYFVVTKNKDRWISRYFQFVGYVFSFRNDYIVFTIYVWWYDNDFFSFEKFASFLIYRQGFSNIFISCMYFEQFGWQVAATGGVLNFSCCIGWHKFESFVIDVESGCSTARHSASDCRTFSKLIFLFSF